MIKAEWTNKDTLDLQTTATDCISRQAAIDALKQQAETMSEWSNRYAEQRKGVLTAVNIVEDLPSAQPEQNTGKWIEKEIYETRQKEEMQVAKCSNCKKYLTTPYIYSFNHYNYCPNCGVEMGNTD